MMTRHFNNSGGWHLFIFKTAIKCFPPFAFEKTATYVLWNW